MVVEINAGRGPGGLGVGNPSLQLNAMDREVSRFLVDENTPEPCVPVETMRQAGLEVPGEYCRYAFVIW